MCGSPPVLVISMPKKGSAAFTSNAERDVAAQTSRRLRGAGPRLDGLLSPDSYAPCLDSPECCDARGALLLPTPAWPIRDCCFPPRCDAPRSWFRAMTARRATAPRRRFTGRPERRVFGSERSVSGPNPRESPGTRGERKAKVGPSYGRFSPQTSRNCSPRRIASHARGRWFEPSRAHRQNTL